MIDSPTFFVAGGTLRRDAPSYVRRQADDDLYEGLSRGEYCYILTARQMGKSSLMVRTAVRLQEAGIAVAVLDLTAIGLNVSPEQWYGGLASQLGHRINLADEVMSFWQSELVLGPLQRWLKTIRDVVLRRRSPQHVVIFIDEIDAVRSLPFAADEFFAGIRECYNQRSEYPEMERLSFCLLGVAAPTDLIRDTRMTPFNIGRRIELHDFTADEAALLARGLDRSNSSGAGILRRIIRWTGGHPYLTQRMCLEIGKKTNHRRPRDVDDLCATLFFSHRAQEKDDNLLFVRERILRSEVDRGGLLDVYRQIRRGNTVRDDEADLLITTLRLSGIVRVDNGRLKVRNRIYSRVFDRNWINAMMPHAELKRQKAAFKRGMWRAAAVAVLVVSLGITFAFIAFKRGQARADRRLLYDAEMRLAQEAWDHSYIDRVEELLNETSPQTGQEDLRGFEWYLLRQFVGGYLWRSNEPYLIVTAVFSGDGERLCIAEYDSSVQPNKLVLKLKDRSTGQEVLSTSEATNAAFPRVRFSSNCDSALLTGDEFSVKQWNRDKNNFVPVFQKLEDQLSDISFSAKSNVLAAADVSGNVRLWDFQKKEQMTLPKLQNYARSISISPNGKVLAIADETSRVRLWYTYNLKFDGEIFTKEGPVTAVAFCPDGHLLTASKNGTLQSWDYIKKRVLATFSGHSGEIKSIAFSPDGQLLATGSVDRTAKLWSISTGHQLPSTKGRGANISSFSPDGRYLVTGGYDRSIKIWEIDKQSTSSSSRNPLKSYLAAAFTKNNDLLTLGIDQANRAQLWNSSTGQKLSELDEPGDKILCANFSADGRLVATGGQGQDIKIWDVKTGQRVQSLKADSRGIAFSPDAKLLVSGGYDQILRLWDVDTGEEKARLNNSLHNSYVAVFSPNRAQIASGTHEGPVQLWDLENRRLLRMFKGHAGQVRVIAFSRDGTRLATGADDHTIMLWDVVTGKLLRKFGVAGRIQRAAFSPDGGRLITGGDDGTLKSWDILSGQELMTLPSHTNRVTSITFSDSGEALATTGDDGTIRLWSAPRNSTEFARATTELHF